MVKRTQLPAKLWPTAQPSAPPRQRRSPGSAGRRPRGSSIFLFLCLLGLSAVPLAGAQSFDWQRSEIGRGTKPALALLPDGSPIVIYMLEALDGWVKIATMQDGAWEEQTIDSGYFYGPPDIVVGPDGVPRASYHDHQGQSFDPGKGDAVFATVIDGTWQVGAAPDPGHDGWDNRVTVEANGRVHMSAIDPVDFGGNGVEYYRQRDDGGWDVEQIGSGPQTYKYATAIAVGADGTPYISYYDQGQRSLVLASRSESGWTRETVDGGDVDAGLFSDLVIDESGGLHLSYLVRSSATSGTVRYAYRPNAGAAWQISDIGPLDSLFFGFTGARNITSIALDSQNRPWVAYSDEKNLMLAAKDGDSWQTQTVVTAETAPLGQITVLALDAQDRPHIAYALVTNKNPLDGTVWYATVK